jgi:hypothetical protein
MDGLTPLGAVGERASDLEIGRNLHTVIVQLLAGGEAQPGRHLRVWKRRSGVDIVILKNILGRKMGASF